MVFLKSYEGDKKQYTKVVKSHNLDSLGRLECYEGDTIVTTYDGISDFSGYVLTNEDGTPAEYEAPEPSETELLQDENKLLKSQIKAQSDRSDFLEDCLAEMATKVYSE